MGDKVDRFRGETDRQRVIRWLKENVEKYKVMIGEETEYKTLVTEKMVCTIQQRINELELKETNSKSTK